MRRRGKLKKAAGLPDLSPEAAAALQDQVAGVALALAGGEDPEAVKALLTPRPDDAAWDQHLMEALAALAHPAVPALLAALFGGATDRPRHKALTKALHLLRTRGVPVAPELFPREEAKPPQPALAPVLARISPIFGLKGERYVILHGPKENLGGNFLVVRISDQEGFLEFLVLDFNRARQQEFWNHFRSQGLADWQEVPTAYAVALLDEAYKINPAKAPEALRYAAVRSELWRLWGRPGEAPALERLLPELNPAELSRYLEQSRQLAQEPVFQTWRPDPAELAPWLEKLKEVQESPLVLTDQQKQTRFDQVMEEATAALYPAAARPLWARRLRHMAYFLDSRGAPEKARAALAAAADLDGAERGPLAGENPFLLALVQSSLALAWQAQPPAQSPEAGSGLLAPPGGPLLHRR